MTELAIRMSSREAMLLEEYSKKARCYLEFGCGGSTVIAVTHVSGTVVSIESDAQWISRVRENPHIKEALSAQRLFLHHVDIGEIKDWGYPVAETKIKNWPRYYYMPFRDYEFDYDFVLVDGKFRNMCILCAALFCGNNCIFAFHDFARRWRHSIAEKYFDIVDLVDTLGGAVGSDE